MASIAFPCFSMKVSLVDVITFYTEIERGTDKSKFHLQIKSKIIAAIQFRILLLHFPVWKSED
jgi:hypothetical protein